MKFLLLILTVSILQIGILTACSNPIDTNLNQDLLNSTLDMPSTSLDSTPVDVESSDLVPEDLIGVWEVFNLLMREYVEKTDLDPAQLEKAAIMGMLEAIEDPYTAYIDPKSFELAMSDTQGSFEGIGAEVTMTPDGKLMIVAPIPDTPAAKAGIRPGDVILEVDGESIEGLSLIESVMKIRGPKGSIVRLQIMHLFGQETELIEITRGIIQISSVNMNITDENFAYINLSVFYENTSYELSEALEKAVKQNVQGIILDLRNNPGGLLSASVEVASHFIKEGLVLYEIDGSDRKTNWSTRQVNVYTDLPIVVLSNEFSASGSEVVIGALQDHKRAIIVGETSFGKGSVNMLSSLTNGGGLYITLARWYTPNGRLIEGEGLLPDVLISQSQNQREDTQFEKAIEVLSNIILDTAK